MARDRALLEKILDKAASDTVFRDALLADAGAALKGAGLMPQAKHGTDDECSVTCIGNTWSAKTCDVTCTAATCTSTYTI